MLRLHAGRYSGPGRVTISSSAPPGGSRLETDKFLKLLFGPERGISIAAAGAYVGWGEYSCAFHSGEVESWLAILQVLALPTLVAGADSMVSQVQSVRGRGR